MPGMGHGGGEWVGGGRQAGHQRGTLAWKGGFWFRAGALMQAQDLHPQKQEGSLTFLSILQSLRCFHTRGNSLSNVRFIIISELNNYYFPLLCRLANYNSDAQRLDDV